MPGATVFHRKLTYLQGAEHDHLVVSSANLTLAGHGKNLEVLDAVSSYREFGEFAGFLEALTREHKFTPMTRTVLQGYRPGKSAKQAIAITRKRCWQYDWVVEFDIKVAFDQIDHALLMKAVRNHIKEDWILL
jgi:hypothetical protein